MAFTKRKKTWVLTLIIVVVAVGITLALGASWSANQPEPKPSPSASETTAPSDAQKMVEGTVQSFTEVIVGDILEQTGIDPESTLKVDTEVSSEDTDGTPIASGTLYLSGLPQNWEIEKNITALNNTLVASNPENGTSWVTLNGTEDYTDQEGILGVYKIFEDTDNPQNPAIVDVVYLEVDGQKTISITATIYLNGKE